MVTVQLRPPFSDPHVLGNPLVMRIISELLGDVRLFTFGGVIALPDAPEQHLHADSGGLFGDPTLDGLVPPYAVSVLIPLVNVNGALTGTTQVLPGSHLKPRGCHSANVACVDPMLPRGSVLLMDYRLVHRGTPNPVPEPRPLLYNVATVLRSRMRPTMATAIPAAHPARCNAARGVPRAPCAVQRIGPGLRSALEQRLKKVRDRNAVPSSSRPRVDRAAANQRAVA